MLVIFVTDNKLCRAKLSTGRSSADLTLDWFDFLKTAMFLLLQSPPKVGRGNRKVQVLRIADRERGDTNEVAPLIKHATAT
jgi:hypothetical protein